MTATLIGAPMDGHGGGSGSGATASAALHIGENTALLAHGCAAPASKRPLTLRISSTSRQNHFSGGGATKQKARPLRDGLV
jgi:hypothetical protein